jgi:hypothetical protein
MAIRNPLQEQLLKAGLAKKQQVDAAAREQARQREGKAPAAEKIDADKLLAERAARDRALAAERNAQARELELRAQIKQIVDAHQVAIKGELPYRFADGDRIKEILVDERLRKQLASGALVIVARDTGYALLPRSAADMIYERGGRVVLDHGRTKPADAESDDEFYRQFVVPDDLIW